jgi:outer membrane protein assembly factor BamD
MIHRSQKLAVIAALAMSFAGCHHNKVSNPIANVDSKQPDKVLFDRAMDAMKHGKYDVARITLQTLINTYPDSEYIARAKLAVGDSWFAEGSTAGYQQAEVEYKDFITFFPNLPEAAEAQLKIANMHYKQMEKADRDFTHAIRAEDEYRQLLQQWPDSKLADQAKQRLREVQEVLGERQYRIGRFYYLRESYPAAIARLKTLADSYPLYSQADDALMMLGNAYESEATIIKNSKVAETAKGRLVTEYQSNAAVAYARIIQRYPVSDRADEARNRLTELQKPIPTPTPEAIAQNKAEDASRSEVSRMHKVMSTFHKGPEDVVRASKVGDPTLVDPQQTSAPQLIRTANNTALGINDTGNGTVTVDKGSGATPGANDPVPRSDATTPPAAGGNPGAPSASDGSSAAAGPGTTSSTPSPAASAGADAGIGELTPSAAPAANGTAAANAATATDGVPTAANGTAATPADAQPQMPAQVNEIQNGSAGTDKADAGQGTSDTTGSSSSKKKKKKGIKKIVPF